MASILNRSACIFQTEHIEANTHTHTPDSHQIDVDDHNLTGTAFNLERFIVKVIRTCRRMFVFQTDAHETVV